MGKKLHFRLKIKQPQLKQAVSFKRISPFLRANSRRKTPCGSLEHPNVMGEDVSEQLTTIEETILKLAKQEKEIVEIGSKAEKLEFSITHAAEQLRLVLLEKKL
jgi:hypothetical protein